MPTKLVTVFTRNSHYHTNNWTTFFAEHIDKISTQKAQRKIKCLSQNLSSLTNVSTNSPTTHICRLMSLNNVWNEKHALRFPDNVTVGRIALHLHSVSNQNTEQSSISRCTSYNISHALNGTSCVKPKVIRNKCGMPRRRSELTFHTTQALQTSATLTRHHHLCDGCSWRARHKLHCTTFTWICLFHDILVRTMWTPNAHFELAAVDFHKGSWTRTWTQLSRSQSESAAGKLWHSSVHRLEPMTMRFLCTHTL